jgi:hypothetical protein
VQVFLTNIFPYGLIVNKIKLAAKGVK